MTESAADAMNNVTTRPAAAADVEWLTAVFLGPLREAITAARGTWDEVRASVQFREQLDLASTRIIDLDGRAVGFFMSPARDTDVELHTLCITPECQSQGVGTYIARGLISDARASRRGVVLYEVILASDGHSTWASKTQTAAEIITEQNTILGEGLVNLRTSSRLVAELRGS